MSARIVVPLFVMGAVVLAIVGSVALNGWYHSGERLQEMQSQRTHEHRAMRAYCESFAIWIRADDRPGIKADIGSLMTERVLYCADGAAPDLVARYRTLATSLFEIADPDKFERVVNELGRLQHDIMNVRTWE